MLHVYRVTFLTKNGHVLEDVSIAPSYAELVPGSWIVHRALWKYEQHYNLPCAPLSITFLSAKEGKDLDLQA